jgi:hypothetical protein
MKDAVLYELANRWEQDAREPVCEDGSPDAQLGNAVARGRREGKREAADCLRSLIHILGDSTQAHQDVLRTQVHVTPDFTDTKYVFKDRP